MEAEGAFAGAPGNDQDAPIPDLPNLNPGGEPI